MDIKVAVGIWFLGATGDRFVKDGYRPDNTVEDRFKMVGGIKGASGLEMHYPSEVTDANYKDLKSLADDLGLDSPETASSGAGNLHYFKFTGIHYRGRRFAGAGKDDI